jgi:hypothetical protein
VSAKYSPEKLSLGTEPERKRVNIGYVHMMNYVSVSFFSTALDIA